MTQREPLKAGMIGSFITDRHLYQSVVIILTHMINDQWIRVTWIQV